MSYSIVFLEKANIDVAKAYKYYGEIGENLIDKFDDDLEKTIERIKNNPKHFRKVKRENRQLLMDIFSYVVVYRLEKESILITRVFHTSRNPKYKFKK
ncbi:MAG TPA: type II toxin-antitoxin system RelE/ParE family toxin [Chitinophagales bacterium]|nr:type II toxin-antitoxin system RelE/ParE family toxin [Chitinophagales bacterium]